MCRLSTWRGGFGCTGPRYRGDSTVNYPLFSVLGHNAGIWFIPIFKTLECPSYLGWKGRWTPGLPVTRCLWDSVPQTSIYSNSNSAVVEPPGGGCNILPRSQVPILGLYYATISTIATSLVLEHVGLLRMPTCGGSSALFSISFSGHVA